jgi:hypothetical protein
MIESPPEGKTREGAAESEAVTASWVKDFHEDSITFLTGVLEIAARRCFATDGTTSRGLC